jgi:23S rRNA (adenine2503-C2)-methyltransferase
MKQILGLPKSVLEKTLNEALPKPFTKKYTIDQLWTALYTTGIHDFEKITCLSKADIQQLKEHTYLGFPEVEKNLKSVDGTRKWLLNFDGQKVETVFIPQVNKSTNGKVGTLCVSSQVGCSLRCSFCHTGTQKFARNLDSTEIISQIVHAVKEVNDFPRKARKPRNLTNIVFMGQGEPLYNFRNVAKAIQFVNDAFGFSSWRTTISTSGVVPLIPAVASELGASLAISLHAVSNDLRDEIVPLNKQYPIELLMKACNEYLSAFGDRPLQQQRITFEYVMLNGVNDSEKEAKELARLVKSSKPHVNLIPFNPWPGTTYTCSSMNRIHRFQRILQDLGIPCHIRRARGQDIMAACGQLKSSSESKSTSARM